VGSSSHMGAGAGSHPVITSKELQPFRIFSVTMSLQTNKTSGSSSTVARAAIRDRAVARDASVPREKPFTVTVIAWPVRYIHTVIRLPILSLGGAPSKGSVPKSVLSPARRFVPTLPLSIVVESNGCV
jgi:hypothetical protein